MKNKFLHVVLLNFLFLLGCNNPSASTENAPDVKLFNIIDLNWKSTRLVDLPNQPQVFVAENEGKAYLAMVDDSGKKLSSIVSPDGVSIKIEDNMFDAESLKTKVPTDLLTTEFSVLKYRLIAGHQRALQRCRSTTFSEAVRSATYENRLGVVLLKLKGPWAEPFSGFEITIALNPGTGAFHGFTITKPLLYTSMSFFSIPDEQVLFGASGHVVRSYSMWISECEDAYKRIQHNKYKMNESEKMDREASELVDLDARIGVFKNLYYDFDEISLEELKN